MRALETGGPLTELLASPDVTEIMVNGPDRIFFERAGKLQRLERRFADEADLLRLIRQLLTASGKTLSPQMPLLDTRLGDGSRMTVSLPPVTATPSFTIRRSGLRSVSLADLSKRGTLTGDASEVLKKAVQAQKNILVAGGTSTGKTTFLNALAAEIPATSRIITLEDTFEISLSHANWVALETVTQGRAEGVIDIRTLVAHALHLRPDRILLGECRGGEALDFLQAMNSGHDGCMATLHASSTRDALARLETLVLMGGVDIPLTSVRQQIARAIHIIVHLHRTLEGKREVTDVVEVLGFEEGQVQLRSMLRAPAAHTSMTPVARAEPHAPEVPPSGSSFNGPGFAGERRPAPAFVPNRQRG
jgi:pilus assembly protein CpaF